MTLLSFDDRTTFLSEYCCDDNGRIRHRDDIETEDDFREIARANRRRDRERLPRVLLGVAMILIIALIVRTVMS